LFLLLLYGLKLLTFIEKGRHKQSHQSRVIINYESSTAQNQMNDDDDNGDNGGLVDDDNKGLQHFH
jgi:hypothetical protein